MSKLNNVEWNECVEKADAIIACEPEYADERKLFVRLFFETYGHARIYSYHRSQMFMAMKAICNHWGLKLTHDAFEMFIAHRYNGGCELEWEDDRDMLPTYS